MNPKPNRHVPVLLTETIATLGPRSGDIVLDATLGNAGHAEVLAKAIGREGVLIGIDADPLAVTEAKEILMNVGPTLYLERLNFEKIAQLRTRVPVKQLDIALFDLGLRTGHLEDTGRGFSFQRPDEALDMRFGPEDSDLTAADIVNSWSEESLADILYGFGGERLARRLATAIVRARQAKPLLTVGDLVEVIELAYPKRFLTGKRSPATKTFQALRMAVNRELETLATGLAAAWNWLGEGGRLGVISFHSLEDRQVKKQFKTWSETEGEIITKKVIKPGPVEIKQNRKSRSATLRVIQKGKSN